MEIATLEPTKRANGLLQRLIQDFGEVRSCLVANQQLQSELADTRQRIKSLEAGEAAYQTHITALEQGSKLADEKATQARDQIQDMTKHCAKLYEQTRKVVAKQTSVDALEKANEDLKEQNRRQADELNRMVVQQRTMSEENDKLQANNTKLNMVNEQYETEASVARQRTVVLEKQLRRTETDAKTATEVSSTRLDDALRQCKQLERQPGAKQQELNAASEEQAGLQDISDAAKRKVDTLETDLTNLRRLLSSHEASYQKTVDELQGQLQSERETNGLQAEGIRAAIAVRDHLAAVCWDMSLSTASLESDYHHLIYTTEATNEELELEQSCCHGMLRQSEHDRHHPNINIGSLRTEVARLHDLLAHTHTSLKNSRSQKFSLDQDFHQCKQELEASRRQVGSLQRALGALPLAVAKLQQPKRRETEDDGPQVLASQMDKAALEQPFTVTEATSGSEPSEGISKALYRNSDTGCLLGCFSTHLKPRVVYVGKDEVEHAAGETVAAYITSLYKRSNDVVVAFRGRVLPHGFALLASDPADALAQDTDLGGLEKVATDPRNTISLKKTPWIMTTHRAEGRHGSTIDEQAVGIPALEVVATHEAAKIVPHDPTTQLATPISPGACKSTLMGPDQDRHAQDTATHQQTRPPTPPTSDSAPQSPLFEPELNPVSTPLEEGELLPVTVTAREQPRDLMDDIVRPISRHCPSIHYPPKRPMYDRAEDLLFRAPKRPRILRKPSYDLAARQGHFVHGRGDSYRPSYG